MTTPPTRRHARRPSERPPVLIRLVQTSDLPDGINSLASADGGTIIVRAGLDKATRRLAVREVLARRFPGLLVFPVMVAMQLRRAVVAVAEGVSRLVQSAACLITPERPVVVLAAGAAVETATAAGGTVMTLTGRQPAAQCPAEPAGAGTVCLGIRVAAAGPHPVPAVSTVAEPDLPSARPALRLCEPIG